LRQNIPRHPSDARRRPELDALTFAPRGPALTPTLRRLRFIRTPCVTVTGLVASIAQKATNEFDVADAATKGRDTCDAIRSRLLRISTDHFDDQASQAWYGVDRMKSGLNALLAYLDTNAPSKLIEARDKLVQGIATAKAGVRAINARRRVYGLKAI
jgi:hypothetical protein